MILFLAIDLASFFPEGEGFTIAIKSGFVILEGYDFLALYIDDAIFGIFTYNQVAVAYFSVQVVINHGQDLLPCHVNHADMFLLSVDFGKIMEVIVSVVTESLKGYQHFLGKRDDSMAYRVKYATGRTTGIKVPVGFFQAFNIAINGDEVVFFVSAESLEESIFDRYDSRPGAREKTHLVVLPDIVEVL